MVTAETKKDIIKSNEKFIVAVGHKREKRGEYEEDLLPVGGE